MPRSPRTLALLVAAGLALAQVACSDPAQQQVSDDPEGSLDEALDNLADYQGTSIEFSLEGSTESLTAVSEGDLKEEDAQKFFDSSLLMTTKEAEEVEDQQAQFVFNLAGQENAFEMQTFGTTLYARADIAGAMDAFGADPASLEAFEQQIASQPGFDFVGPFLDGEWISITGAEQFAEQLTGKSVEEQTADQQAMAEELANSLRDNAEVDAGDEEGPGGQLVVTIPLRQLFEDFKELSEAAGTLASGGAPLPDSEDLPDEDIVLDVWVDDAEITQVELNITQFADWEGAEEFPEGVEDLRLRMTVDEFTGSLEEPNAASEVDFQELMGLMMGGAAGTGGGSTAPPSGTGEVCDEIEAALEGQPDEVIDQAKAQYKDLCPNLGN
ncbi:MAG: hypothetical protein ACRDJV_05715 [Actinomycetota bacterium]